MTRYVLIAIQGLVIAVGYTSFLGRVFRLNLYEELGIPISEASLSTIDYALAHPPIAVTGVGLAIVMVLVQFINSETFQIMPLHDKRVIRKGLLWLAIVSLICVIVNTVFQFRDSTYSAFLVVILIASSAVVIQIRSSERAAMGDTRIRTASSQRVVLGFYLTGLGIFYVLMTMVLSDYHMRVEADRILNTAPSAQVEFTSEAIEDVEDAKVILLNDRFVYLYQAGQLSAVPMDEVARITYD